MKECIHCATEVPSDVWEPGQVCLFGSLFACCVGCAARWIETEFKNVKDSDYQDHGFDICCRTPTGLTTFFTMGAAKVNRPESATLPTPNPFAGGRAAEDLRP
jgi:hypothetical protein